jgi:hypothetical protein
MAEGLRSKAIEKPDQGEMIEIMMKMLTEMNTNFTNLRSDLNEKMDTGYANLKKDIKEINPLPIVIFISK